jgi:hypothetical protein
MISDEKVGFPGIGLPDGSMRAAKADLPFSALLDSRTDGTCASAPRRARRNATTRLSTGSRSDLPRGSCGTAAYRRQAVIVSDIATDPLWELPRDFVLSVGLRARWSMPIFNETGGVLGTVAGRPPYVADRPNSMSPDRPDRQPNSDGDATRGSNRSRCPTKRIRRGGLAANFSLHSSPVLAKLVICSGPWANVRPLRDRTGVTCNSA